MNHMSLSLFSSDKMFPAFGFGALIPPDFKVWTFGVCVCVCMCVCSCWGSSGHLELRSLLEAQLAFDQHERRMHLSTCKLDWQHVVLSGWFNVAVIGFVFSAPYEGVAWFRRELWWRQSWMCRWAIKWTHLTPLQFSCSFIFIRHGTKAALQYQCCTPLISSSLSVPYFSLSICPHPVSSSHTYRHAHFNTTDTAGRFVAMLQEVFQAQRDGEKQH